MSKKSFRIDFWNRRNYVQGASKFEFPVWLLCLSVLILLALLVIASNGNYRLVFERISNGLWITIKVSIVSFLIALVFGFLLSIMRISRSRILREISTFYVELVRGLPMIVILYYVAFIAAPSIIDLCNAVFAEAIASGVMPAFEVRNFGATERAIFALSLGYASFIAEIFRAGFESVPVAQTEAALSLGMKRRQALFYVVFPQAFRNVLPALGNDFVSMIKDSSLVSVLGISDITGIGRTWAASSYQVFEPYNIMTLLYLMLTLSLSLLIRLGEKRLRGNQKKLSHII